MYELYRFRTIKQYILHETTFFVDFWSFFDLVDITFPVSASIRMATAIRQLNKD